MIAKMAKDFKADIRLESNDKKINAKSIISIMSSGLKQNSQVKLVINGSDEKEAFDSIVALFESGFGEI